MIYPQLSDCEIGFIGAGNISDAIANGFINSGIYLSKLKLLFILLLNLFIIY